MKFRLVEKKVLTEGTKYDKKAIAKLTDSGLFNEETSTKIVNALFKEDIHAFVHSPSWLEKYLIGIVNMLIKYCNGDRSKAQEFLTNSIEYFEEYLTYIKELRPTLPQEKQLELDKTFNEQMSYEDMLKELEDIKAKRDAESADKLKDATFDEDSDFELVPIDSYEQFNSMFGGAATGDGSSDKYAGGGGTAWCHTNSESTYKSWVKGKYKFFVLAHKDWKNIPFDKESNSNNPKDEYGNSLIAILVNKQNGQLSKATLRCNHVGVPSNADNQYNTYAELSAVAGFNVEEAVKSTLDNLTDDDTEDLICDSCGCVIEDEDDAHETPDGDTYCEDCFWEEYTVCDGCGIVIYRDDSHYANDCVYCTTCFDEYYCYCYECGDPVELDYVYDTPDGPMCEYCFDRSDWRRCDDCGEIADLDYMYWVDSEGAYYCEYCFSRNFFVCDKCGEYFGKEDSVDTEDGDTVCQDCYDRYYADEEDEDDVDESFDDLKDTDNIDEFLEKFGM